MGSVPVCTCDVQALLTLSTTGTDLEKKEKDTSALLSQHFVLVLVYPYVVQEQEMVPVKSAFC